MEKAHKDIGAIIIRNAELLESAIEYGVDTIDARLGREIIAIFDQKLDEFGWQGGQGGDERNVRDNLPWLAPEEWISKTKGDGEYDLYLDLDCDNHDKNTMAVSDFLGVAGSGMYMVAVSDTLKKQPLKKLLKDNPELIKEFTNKSFRWELTGQLKLPIKKLEREPLATAFGKGDFTEALGPIEKALDRIDQSRSLFDQLAVLIRDRLSESEGG